MALATHSGFMSRLQQRLEAHGRQGLVRHKLLREGPCAAVQRFGQHERVSFCSNDYLGLANHPAVIAAWQEGAARYGVGSGGSHLVTGHCRAHQALEQALAEFTGRERALLFSTGYMANIGVINALMHEGGVVLQDALNHASLLDGGWLSRARSIRYPHNDMQALADLLVQHQQDPCLIVSDGVFSMDGDVAPLPEMARLATAHGAGLMIDDAHGIACLGDRGRGVIELFPEHSGRGNVLTARELPVLVGTFGKALGTAGAFVAGDAVLIEYLEQFARSYVFTTAMPPALAVATLTSLRVSQDESWRRERLQLLIRRFRQAMADMAFPVLDSHSAVQAVVLGDVDTTLAASALLRDHGLQVSAIRPPTVPRGEARLRITLSAVHTDTQFDQLLQALMVVNDRFIASRSRSANASH
ncbi:MAG: 8-amino-7-oxononanoate synthase [Gammaproteobacteria bacterium]|nr:8-amino-7-oxononanoate synthase [Gammaproteobacteria bacterium]|tara:strand:- start:4355 stop:5599 length:1245 start_codon:yes stop_codon:yes gene_type:complete